MRLVTFDDGRGARPGVLVDERVIACAQLGSAAGSVRELLEESDAAGLVALGERAAESGGGVAREELRLLAPLGDPQKIICLGLNYRDHAAEAGLEVPEHPRWFAKFANSLVGDGADVVLPAAHPRRCDYEAELAVVIGRRCHGVDEQEALEFVAGAMPFNDVSARDLQMQSPLWVAGKAVDSFAPCGPALVTLDEAGDVGALGLRTRINGEVVQEGNTADMIFSVAQLVAWLSRTMTLVPGDIIATGTPAGVGAVRRSYLQPGDVMEVEVDGLGSVTNTVVLEG
jgi:2-keto-4-pentenoate hydratase/2-oxohepta-3-ene-1,7-dioic acid hydratase in catechol pathway